VHRGDSRSSRAINQYVLSLNEPAVTTATGGANGGGSVLTPVGQKTIQLYHSIENAYPSRHAQRISGFSEIDARLSGGGR
jgi:molybdate transport system regulatory protein